MRLKFGRRKLWASATALIAVAVALVVWSTGGLEALVGVVLLAVIAASAALGYFMAESERHIRSQIVTLSRASDQGLSALDKKTEAINDRVNALSEHLDSIDQHVDVLVRRTETPGGQAEQLLKAIAASHRRVELAQAKHIDQVFRQYEALSALYMDTGARAGFPPTRSWVASPDTLLYLHGLAKSDGVETIVECGSGLSTIIMAYALRDKGRGRVFSLEHLEEYAERTVELLERHGVMEWAEVRLAPLEVVSIDDEVWPWYRLERVPEGPIDLLFVDGPPGNTKSLARYPAVPLLFERLSDGGVVVLDDLNRSDESEIATLWEQRFPGLVKEILRHEKGTAVFRRSGAAS